MTITATDLSAYKVVKDKNGPIYFAAIFVALVYCSIPFLPMQNSRQLYFWLLPLMFLLPLFQFFRPRTCPECGARMQRFSPGILPHSYYCEKCRTRIPIVVTGLLGNK
jgi:hypothetical protein